MQLRPKPIVLHVNRQVQREAAFSNTILGPESYPCDGMMPVAWNDAHVMEERYPCDGMNFAYKKILLISVDGIVGLPLPWQTPSQKHKVIQKQSIP